MRASDNDVKSRLRRGSRRVNDLLERNVGVRLVRTHRDAPELVGMEDSARVAMAKVRGRTMTDPLQQYAAYSAARYVSRAGIAGDIVECGVWRGGASLLMMMGLMDEGDSSRTVWLYDTFEGMTKPDERDAFLATGHSAQSLLASASRTGSTPADWTYWCVADEDDVRRGVLSSDYPSSRVQLIKGPVETTLATTVPDKVAIARLDTDWYESTKIELEVLFPRLSPGGVLIVDDYDDWAGARQAVDEYFGRQNLSPFLIRSGYGRVLVKNS